MQTAQDNAKRAPSPRGPYARPAWLNIQVEPESYQPPRWSVLLLQGLIITLFFVFAVRFWYLQILKGEQFARQASDNRIREERILAPRGLIRDKTGHILADNRLAYCLALTREDCPDIPSTLAQISAWTGSSPEALYAKYQQGLRNKVQSFEKLLLLTDIPFELVARIESQLVYWPGLEIVTTSKRNYPETALFAHILGYVAEAGEKEMEADKNLYLGDTVGKQGLEYVLDKHLRGQKGLYRLEVDVLGRSLGRELIEMPKSGEPARLSLDLGVQKAAWDALEGQSGGIVVMEPDTGRLVALVTSPSYDNNAFAAGLSHKEWGAIRDDPRHPLQNRVIQSVYPPGSVWKLVMAELLLKEGVRPGESVQCSGQVQLGDQIFRCWKKDGHGSVDMMSALVQSCDVYFYHWGERMGIDRIAAFAHAAGFGELTGIDLPYENRGLVPSRAWKKRRFRQPWVRGETLNVSIGQGSTLITPVQLATFVSSLMNGGKLLKPLLMEGGPVSIRGEVPGSPEARKFILESMRRTVEGGTAKVLQRPDAVMGGKTGTAQVVKLKFAAGDRRLKTHEMAYEQRDHAWIASYGEKAGKRYVVVAMVEHGGGGGAVAGPVAKKVYEHLFGTLATASAGKQ